MEYGTPIHLGDHLKPGRLIVRPPGQNGTGFLYIQTKIKDEYGEFLAFHFHSFRQMAFIDPHSLTGLAWDVDDVMMLVPDLASAEVSETEMMGGQMFLTSDGDIGMYARKGGNSTTGTAFNITNGEHLRVPSDCIAFKRWRLVSKGENIDQRDYTSIILQPEGAS
ncbi:MAG: hypothetical protein JJ931_04300 [Henriciella sp.]|nr:hypothetical protein [Henriciella sp.]MBO6694622.1 hypothetical protein [Henriciella sp.]